MIDAVRRQTPRPLPIRHGRVFRRDGAEPDDAAPDPAGSRDVKASPSCLALSGNISPRSPVRGCVPEDCPARDSGRQQTGAYFHYHFLMSSGSPTAINSGLCGSPGINTAKHPRLRCRNSLALSSTIFDHKAGNSSSTRISSHWRAGTDTPNAIRSTPVSSSLADNVLFMQFRFFGRHLRR